MSKTLRLELFATYLTWQEVVVPDDFDASDPAAMEQLFSDMPFPHTPEPRNGRAEITQRIAWEKGRVCYLRCFVE